MYGFKSMLICLNPKQNILKILDKNSSSIIFLAKIISSKHICAKFCYKYLGAEARAMVYNYYLIRNQHHRIDTRAKFRSKQSVFKFWDQIGPKKVLEVEISKNYYHIRNQHPRIHTRAKFHLKQIIFKFWEQIRSKQVLGAEISKNYYHIPNQHLQIHTSAKFRLRKGIFKFWDQKKYFSDKIETGERFLLSFLGCDIVLYWHLCHSGSWCQCFGS